MIEFTGERYVPNIDGKIRLEHYHRYLSVLNHVQGKYVLDVACGEGYGSSLIAHAALGVEGVDVAVDAIDHAASTYTADNLKFRQASVLNLPYEDATFDVVLSFETIEHLVEQGRMLDEIHRVLKADGLLIISSPNKDVYSKEDGQHNEFHLKELNFNEFDEMLSKRFSSIAYAGQRVVASSFIDSIYKRNSSAQVFTDNSGLFEPGTKQLESYVYYIAYCSNKLNDLASPGTSFAVSTNNDLIQHYTALGQWAASQNSEIDQKNSRILELQGELEERTAWALSLDRQLNEKNSQIAVLERELEETKSKVKGKHKRLFKLW